MKDKMAICLLSVIDRNIPVDISSVEPKSTV